MLHSHPRIAIAPETRFLLRTYLSREQFGDLHDEENRRSLATAITTPGPKTKFGDLRIDRAATVERIVKSPPTLGSAFAAVWEEFAESRGKQRWGEKRPKYCLWTDAILRMFPDTQFVHIVRDPRACIASLLATTWWPGGFERALTAWVRAERSMHRLERRAAPDVYYRLRYEDLVTSPREQLRALCGYLGESFDERMLDHTKAADDIVLKRQHHHDLTHRPVDPTRIERWRTSLTPEQIGLVELAAGRAMHRHGYPPSGIGRRPSPAFTARFLKTYAARVYHHRKDVMRDARQRWRETQPLAAMPVDPIRTGE